MNVGCIFPAVKEVLQIFSLRTMGATMRSLGGHLRRNVTHRYDVPPFQFFTGGPLKLFVHPSPFRINSSVLIWIKIRHHRMKSEMVPNFDLFGKNCSLPPRHWVEMYRLMSRSKIDSAVSAVRSIKKQVNNRPPLMRSKQKLAQKFDDVSSQTSLMELNFILIGLGSRFDNRVTFPKLIHESEVVLQRLRETFH